ncbi:APC family permease [Trebonia kvetii]|uniref:APC family permease n=1 Tax=Trebonia kvetii TaxID=2480626 RepID=A0A6P2C0S6_9ACTN|nr:APC family permease [Trebonia kvetii]TVZ04085.1 APC family permease [Trebonia kvetii]
MATTLSQTVKPADVGLKRELGLIAAMWSSETSIIGSGWLLGSFAAAQLVGSAAIIDWVLGAIAAILLALVHAELGAMYPVAGGTARFPHLAFGPGAGISFGFFSWLQAVTVPPIEAYAVIHYAGYYWKAIYDPNAHGGSGNVTHLGFVMEIVLMLIFTALNFLPMRIYGPFYTIVTWWKVIIPVVTIIILFTKFNGGNFSAGGGFFPTGVSWKDLFGALPGAGIVFAYLGFEQADQLAGEIKNPQRNLPIAIVGSIIIGAVIYILLQIVLIGATPASLLTGKGFAGIASSNAVALAPFAALAGLGGFSWLAGLLRVDAFISPGGTGAIYNTSTSRVAFGLARNRYFPSIFASVDRNGVPWFGMVTAFLFGLVFTFPFPSWHSLVGLVTSASVLMYAGAPLSVGALRYRLPGADRPFRLPAASVISPLSFVVASLIIYWSDFETLWKLGIAIILGYIAIGMYNSDRPGMPKINWRKSAWLGAYLLGMGIISWQGAYGPDNTGRLLYPWDILVVALFSLAIYFWAVYEGSQTTEEIEERIAEQAAPAEEEAEGAAA